MIRRKVAVVTGTRAEFGLLYWTIKGILDDTSLELQLIVTGMHLSPEFGMTVKEIEESNFPISKKVEILMSSDTPVGISKSMGLGMISFAEVYEELKPDICLVLGDRYEIFAAVSAAMIARIPVAHCHGGESTQGLIDEPIRHSITKMSHLHFTSIKEYTDRVIQLGENPNRVFNVGALSIENIYKLKLLNKAEFEENIDFKIISHTFLFTFHPVTLDKGSAEEQIKSVLNSLDNFPNAKIIFTMPNADTDGRIIMKHIDSYVANNSERAIAFSSLGRIRYLSALRYVDLVIGNSSSGLVEVPSFGIPTVNIGDRQRGRVHGGSVINTACSVTEITSAIEKALSSDFRKKVKEIKNPYDAGFSSEKILKVLREYPLEGILKKKFFDL